MNAARPIEQYAALSGILDSAAMIAARLAEAARCCHLISPSTTCVALRPGCVVNFNVVRLEKPEWFNLSGAAVIGRAGLLRLANAAGFTLIPASSYRVDHGRDPHYCHWHAEGAWLDLDGTTRMVPGDYQLDLRDGSAQVREVLLAARGNTPEEREEAGRRNLMHKRAKVLELAQSGAALRAIRAALAIRSYGLDEIALPFVVARLAYTGHDENPEIERDNKRAIRDDMLGGMRGLFGHAPARALPPARDTYELPPVGSVPAGESVEATRAKALAPPAPPVAMCEYCGVEGPVTTVTGPGGSCTFCDSPKCHELAHANAQRDPEPATSGLPARPTYPGASAPTPSGRAAPGASSPTRPTASRDEGSASGAASGYTIPGGRDKGQPIEQASDKTLQYWIERIADALSCNRTRPEYRDKDERMLAAMRSEKARRQMADREAPPDGGPDPTDDIPF